MRLSGGSVCLGVLFRRYLSCWALTLHPVFSSLPDPLSPANLTLSITGEAGSLQARWTPPAGERDHYLVTLLQGVSRALARNVSVGGDSAHVSFHGLSPGNQYSVRVTAVAGPHRAPSPSAAAWTRKQRSRAHDPKALGGQGGQDNGLRHDPSLLMGRGVRGPSR